MAGTHEPHAESTKEARLAAAETVPSGARHGSPAVTGDRAAQPEQHAAPTTTLPPGSPPEPSGPPAHAARKWVLLAGAVVGLAVAVYLLVPWVITALNTVSTDDAYVNSHVTFVAPRVAGQVTEVLVDDNYRVKKGALLVQLDKEPYQVQVAIKKASVEVAQTNLVAAEAQVRGEIAQARANRFKLEHAIEDVDNQIANLRASVATAARRLAIWLLTFSMACSSLKRLDRVWATRPRTWAWAVAR
ncbi:MAG TPA: biotin/lipoyl-binding protein, partial [Terriglobia bacterium]|nr:biotin/lipoyl-binding protein [Terriglobia bacterium]